MSNQGLSPAAILRAELQSAHRILDDTMADVTDEIANRPAPGNANPIGASYAHVALAEDAIINGMFRGQPPLLATTWVGKTGTDKPMPMPGVFEGDIGEWYHTVRVNLAACRAYAQAVYAQSEEFIGSADDATLSREIDLTGFGLGKVPLALVLGMFVTGHANNLCGEISAIKGVNGLRGYPF
jgi:hypothetical protein